MIRKLRKDKQIDRVLGRIDAGLISEHEAGERILLIEERHDDARRRRHNIA